MSEKSRLVGNKLKHLRVERHVSQKQIAEAIGVSQAHWSNIENGRNNITLENLLKLGEFFQMPVAEFFVEVDKEYIPPVQSVKESCFTMEEFLQALLALKKQQA